MHSQGLHTDHVGASPNQLRSGLGSNLPVGFGELYLTEAVNMHSFHEEYHLLLIRLLAH